MVRDKKAVEWEIGEKIGNRILIEIIDLNKSKTIGKLKCECGREEISSLRESLRTKNCRACGQKGRIKSNEIKKCNNHSYATKKYSSLIGIQYKYRKLLEILPSGKIGNFVRARGKVVCLCGREDIIKLSDFSRAPDRSCQDCKNRKISNDFIDLNSCIGKKLDSYQIIELFSKPRRFDGNRKFFKIMCNCDSVNCKKILIKDAYSFIKIFQSNSKKSITSFKAVNCKYEISKMIGVRKGKRTCIGVDGKNIVYKCDCGFEDIMNFSHFRRMPIEINKFTHGCKNCRFERASYHPLASLYSGIVRRTSVTELSTQYEKSRNFKYYFNNIKNEFKTFEDFLEEIKKIGERPGLKYSIDRIDNKGNYKPGNIRWATNSEQQNNKDVSLKNRKEGEVFNLISNKELADQILKFKRLEETLNKLVTEKKRQKKREPKPQGQLSIL